MTPTNNQTEVFTDGEMQEIRSFLFSNYLQASAGLPSANARKPKEQVDPEIQRIRRLSKAKRAGAVISTDDVRELGEAAASPFGQDFSAVRQEQLAKVLGTEAHNIPAAPAASLPFAKVLLKNLMKRICGPAVPVTLKSAAISTASLSAIMAALGLPPLLAPLAVWFGVRIRDVGLPVLCQSVQEFYNMEGGAHGANAEKLKS